MVNIYNIIFSLIEMEIQVKKEKERIEVHDVLASIVGQVDMRVGVMRKRSFRQQEKMHVLVRSTYK